MSRLGVPFNGGLVYDDTGWIKPTLLNSWVSYDGGATYGIPAYRRLNGIVYFRGFMKNGTANTTIFTLPVGFRPSKRSYSHTLGQNSGTNTNILQIEPTGEFSIISMPSNAYVTLEPMAPYPASDFTFGGLTSGLVVPTTYDAAVSGFFGASVVHRWKFDETTGTTVADSVGILPLTLAGTYTRNVASKTGVATQFASATATATGTGNVPLGNSARCFIALLRTSGADQAVFNYGATGTVRAWWEGGTYQLATWGDDYTGIDGNTLGGNDWHVMWWGYDGALGMYHGVDQFSVGFKLAGNLVTAASNFQIGQSGYAPSQQVLNTGDIDDLLVLNTWPGLAKMRKFARSVDDVLAA